MLYVRGTPIQCTFTLPPLPVWALVFFGCSRVPLPSPQLSDLPSRPPFPLEAAPPPHMSITTAE